MPTVVFATQDGKIQVDIATFAGVRLGVTLLMVIGCLAGRSCKTLAATSTLIIDAPAGFPLRRL